MAEDLTDEQPQRSRTSWREPTIFLGLFIVVALLIALPSRVPKRELFAIKVVGIITNSAGVPEVIVTLRNAAADVWIEPRVQVAEDEEYGTADGNQLARLNKLGFPWLSADTSGGSTKYHAVKKFAVYEAGLEISTGTNLMKGEVATFRFARPGDKSFRLMVDCWRFDGPPKYSMRHRLEKWNGWANTKLSVPIVFPSRSWAHQQIFGPLISSRDIKAGEVPRWIGQEIEVEVQ
jgi:hypothetical protein